MVVSFTFVPTTTRGQVRSYIQDTNVGDLVNRVTSAISANVVNMGAAFMVANELIGEYVYPDVSSFNKYKIVSNTTSTLTVKGDLGNVTVSGTSAIVNEALFTDDEIDSFITQGSSNILKASAIGLRAIAASRALLAKRFKRSGVGGIEIDQRDIKEIVALAESYEKQADNYAPASCVNSMEVGRQERSDDFELNDYDEFGDDLSTYNTE